MKPTQEQLDAIDGICNITHTIKDFNEANEFIQDIINHVCAHRSKLGMARYIRQRSNV